MKKLPILEASLRFVASYAVNPGENSYKSHMLWNHSSLATFLSLTVKAHVHSVTHGQLQKPQHTYVKCASVKRTLMWIGHSRSFKGMLINTGRNPQRCVVINVQLMPTLFLKLTKTKQRENGKFVDLNDPTPIWRRCCKKRLPISRNNLYCEKLESLIHFCRR